MRSVFSCVSFFAIMALLLSFSICRLVRRAGKPMLARMLFFGRRAISSANSGAVGRKIFESNSSSSGSSSFASFGICGRIEVGFHTSMSSKDGICEDGLGEPNPSMARRKEAGVPGDARGAEASNNNAVPGLSCPRRMRLLLLLGVLMVKMQHQSVRKMQHKAFEKSSEWQEMALLAGFLFAYGGLRDPGTKTALAVEHVVLVQNSKCTLFRYSTSSNRVPGTQDFLDTFFDT